MSEMILELEGFLLRGDQDFVVKELAYYDIHRGYHACWCFLPPYPWRRLSPAEQKSSCWVTQYCHGLEWESGDLPYSALDPVLESLSLTYRTLYTKGLEKKLFLERQCQKPIQDLNQFQCPTIEFLKDEVLGSNRVPVQCPRHDVSSEHCALQKAYRFAGYMKNRGRNVLETQPKINEDKDDPSPKKTILPTPYGNIEVTVKCFENLRL